MSAICGSNRGNHMCGAFTNQAPRRRAASWAAIRAIKNAAAVLRLLQFGAFVLEMQFRSALARTISNRTGLRSYSEGFVNEN